MSTLTNIRIKHGARDQTVSKHGVSHLHPPVNTKQPSRWVTAQDGLENLRLQSAAMPVPKQGEVLVKTSTVALNYRDTEGESTR